MIDLIEQLKAANIVGRGGAEYPAWRKWEAVRDAPATPKYVIANASEREPGVFKDLFILMNHEDDVFAGLELAMQAVGAAEGIFNMNADYEEKLKDQLAARIAKAKETGFKIRVFEESPTYIGGEETALLNAMEGERVEPRHKPPFPTASGLHGKPTLIHNIETLYDVACVANGTYEYKRFFCVSGAVPNRGVFHLPASSTVLQVLQETGNIPHIPYFVQVGGGSGPVYGAEQLASTSVHGTGAIIVHPLDENPRLLARKWLDFFHRESCGKCTPCREGTYQLVRLIEDHDELPWERMAPIFETLEKTSFCALGRSVPVPLVSYYRNILHRS